MPLEVELCAVPHLKHIWLEGAWQYFYITKTHVKIPLLFRTEQSLFLIIACSVPSDKEKCWQKI